HVGQAGHGLDGPHGVAEALVGLLQRGPLLHGQPGVDGLAGVHPRVDRVLHGEVTRRAHVVWARGVGTLCSPRFSTVRPVMASNTTVMNTLCGHHGASINVLHYVS